MNEDHLLEIKQELAEMRAEIKPVIETFNNLRALGKWTAVIIAFFGSVTAIIVGWKEIFKK